MKILGVLFRIEALKAVKRRAFWVAVAAFALFIAIPAVEGVRNARRYPNQAYGLPESWPDILSAATGIGPFFVGVLMILLFAPEFTWRTGRQNVIDGLSKERFYAGKVIVLAGLILLFMAATVLIGVGGTLLSPGESGPGILRATDLSYMSGFTLSLMLVGSAGLMLSALVRSSGSALGILFLCLIAEQAATGLISRAGKPLRHAVGYLPSNILEDLGDDLAHYPEELAEVNAERAELGLEPWEFLDVEILAIAALAYSANFLVIAFLSLRRRDL